MKNKAATIILIISFVIITFLSVLTQIKINEINNLKAEIEELSNREFSRVTVVNDYWQRTTAGKTLYGNITFDDISLIKDLEITFKNEVFCPVLVETAIIAINAEDNQIVTSCIYNDESPSFAVVTVFYHDGRTEDITIRICMG